MKGKRQSKKSAAAAPFSPVKFIDDLFLHVKDTTEKLPPISLRKMRNCFDDIIHTYGYRGYCFGKYSADCEDVVHDIARKKVKQLRVYERKAVSYFLEWEIFKNKFEERWQNMRHKLRFVAGDSRHCFEAWIYLNYSGRTLKPRRKKLAMIEELKEVEEREAATWE